MNDDEWQTALKMTGGHKQSAALILIAFQLERLVPPDHMQIGNVLQNISSALSGIAGEMNNNRFNPTKHEVTIKT